MRWFIFLRFILAIQLVGTAHAFDPRTHVWVGQQVLNDVLPDGKVTIDGKEYSVPSAIVAALRENQDAYRMGHIGPDAHPDFFVGQCIHPGFQNGWKVDDWAKWIQDNAQQSGSLAAVAYSAGFWGHMAGDIVAHSYINIYAGDYFLITDEQEVELRHIVLEHFIGAKTPPLVDQTGVAIAPYESCLKTPAAFLAQTLIINDSAAKQYMGQPASTVWEGTPVIAQWRLHKAVHDLRVDLEQQADKLKAAIAKTNTDTDEAIAKLSDIASKFEELNPGLKPLELQVAALKAAVDAQRAIFAPIEAAASAGEKALLAAQQKVDNLTKQIDAASKRLNEELPAAIAASDQKVAELNTTIEDWTQKAADATDQAKHLQELKGELEKSVSKLGKELDKIPGGQLFKKAFKKAQRALDQAQGKFDDATRQLSTALDNVSTAADNVKDFAAQKATEVVVSSNLIADKVTLNITIASLKSSLAVAKNELVATKQQFGELSSSLSVAQQNLNKATALFDKASDELRTLRLAISKLEDQRKQLQAGLRELADLHAQLVTLQSAAFGASEQSVVGRLEQWEKDIESASVAYIQAASDSIVANMREKDFIQPFADWFACWAPVLTGVPNQVTSPGCDAVAHFRVLSEQIRNLTAPLASRDPVAVAIAGILKRLDTDVLDILSYSGIELVDHLFSPVVSDFAKLRSKHYDETDLDKNFSKDDSGKQLLVFDNFAKTVKVDLGMNEGDEFFDPDKFPPAFSAVTIAKLTLLDAAGINRFAETYNMAGRTAYSMPDDPDAVARLLYPHSDGFVNILFRAVKSIDGNQQWRGEPLPYLRRDGKFKYPDDIGAFGYLQKDDPSNGFRLWVDLNYRRDVFLKILPALKQIDTLAPGIHDALAATPNYPSDDLSDAVLSSSENTDPARSPHAPIIREPAARDELERTRRAETETLPAVTLLDRVDGLSRDQLVAAARAQTRIELSAEIRKEIIDDLERKSQWSADYNAALLAAKSSHKGLLVVIDTTDGAGHLQQADLSVDELQAKLFEPFQLCRIDAGSGAGQNLIRSFCIRSLPAIAIVDARYAKTLTMHEGPMTYQKWASLLIAYGRCWPIRQ